MQLHASDLRVLSPDSSLSSSISRASSSLQLPYVPMKRENPFPDFAEVISRKCGSKIVHTAPGGLSGSVQQDGDKHVVCMSMPPLAESEGSHRMNLLGEHGASHSVVGLEPRRIQELREQMALKVQLLRRWGSCQGTPRMMGIVVLVVLF